jgi:hypothetical protein
MCTCGCGPKRYTVHAWQTPLPRRRTLSFALPEKYPVTRAHRLGFASVPDWLGSLGTEAAPAAELAATLRGERGARFGSRASLSRTALLDAAGLALAHRGAAWRSAMMEGDAMEGLYTGGDRFVKGRR